jgi:hypothetical protein
LPRFPSPNSLALSSLSLSLFPLSEKRGTPDVASDGDEDGKDDNDVVAGWSVRAFGCFLAAAAAAAAVAVAAARFVCK